MDSTGWAEEFEHIERLGPVDWYGGRTVVIDKLSKTMGSGDLEIDFLGHAA